MNVQDVAGLRIGSTLPNVPDDREIEPWELHMHCMEPLIWGYSSKSKKDFITPIDIRKKLEEMTPAIAFSEGYWAKHLIVILETMYAADILTPREIEAALYFKPERIAAQSRAVPEAVTAEEAIRSVKTRWPRPEEAAPARHKVGDVVTVIAMNPVGHTRCPAYVRGKTGTITDDLGPHHLPDARPLSERGRVQHAYTVSFDGIELWGVDGHRNDFFEVDLLDDYLTCKA